jgi:hypothetical protein
MYRISAYFIAKQISELPLQFGTPIIFVVITYWAVGLRADVGAFVVFLVIVIVLNFVVNSYGMLMGALLPAALTALFVPVLLIISLLAAGFYVNPENFPGWISWVRYLSVFYYGFNAVIVNQFTGLKFYCKKDQFIVFSDTAVCSDGERVLAKSSYCPNTKGQQIIDRTNSDALEIWEYILILLGMAFALRILTYVALRKVHPQEIELN